MDKEKWILPYLKQYRGLFLLAIFLGAFTILMGGGLLFTSGYLISKAATRPESILMVYVPIVGVRTFAIGRAVLSYFERLTGHSFVLRILSEIRVRLYKAIEPHAVSIRSRFLTGDILGILADDIEHLQNFYLKTLFPSIFSLVNYTVVIIFFGAFSIPFAVSLAFLIGILIFLGPIFSYIFMKRKNEYVKQGRYGLYLQFTDAVFGICDWFISGRHSTFIQNYEKQQQQLLSVESKIHSFVNGRSVFNQIVLGTIVLVAIYWANGMTRMGQIPPTFIAAFGLVMLSLVESFLPISEAVSDLSTYQESLKRLHRIEERDGPNGVEEEKPSLGVYSNVSIELRDVSFQFPQGPYFLNRFSLKVGGGEKVAILGPSGAGKSTVLKLIQGALQPSSGEVLLNRKNADKLILSIPSMMSVLNQKAYLFHTSVINNIRLGNPEASDEEVYEAAKQVQLHELIKGLPDGYHTSMQETGQRFSGGERQRIALARILLQQTPVVLMDEPTVGLDPITENQLLTTIFDVLKGKTIIWVTHHLTGMEKMDRILFLDHGKITMEGSHQQLVEKEERYRRLYALDHPFTINNYNNIR